MEVKRKCRISFFPVGDSQKSKRVFLEVYAWLGVSVKVATFFCHQVDQIWSYRAVIFFPCSKSRDLGPEHGFRTCSFKNKGKTLDFHEQVGFWGVKKPKKNEKVERNRSNVGLRSSRWYQNDREGRRGYFRKFWSWNFGIFYFPCFSSFSFVFLVFVVFLAGWPAGRPASRPERYKKVEKVWTFFWKTEWKVMKR